MTNEIKNNEDLKNKKILVIEEVEDDASLRNAIRTKLSLEGFNVLEAKNGEEGLAIALAKHPDLILLDIVMPKIDGITMMKKLRQENEWGKNVPIILLTNLGKDDDKIIQAVSENEPAYYIVKSDYSMKELIEKIRQRLSREE
ncbi:MAG: response regulator [bacterium]